MQGLWEFGPLLIASTPLDQQVLGNSRNVSGDVTPPPSGSHIGSPLHCKQLLKLTVVHVISVFFCAVSCTASWSNGGSCSVSVASSFL